MEIAIRDDIAIYDAMFVATTEAMESGGITSDTGLLQKIQHDFPQIQPLQ